MSISWVGFWPHGPRSPRRLQNKLPSGRGHLTGREASIMSISWVGFWPRGPRSPSGWGHLTSQEASIMSISWGPTDPEAQDACRTNCPSGWRHLTSQEASIMSISWVGFWPHGPRSPRRLQNKLPRGPRSRRLQNKLPQWLGPFDEPGGEHHEHQLGRVLAPRTPKPKTLAEQTAPVVGAI